MELRQIIDLAAQKTGSVRNLAKVIGVSDSNLTAAKAGRRGLPAIACGKLAEILEIDRWQVVAASELVTERNEEKRAYFTPFVLNGITGLATVATALLLSTASKDSFANDTFNVSAPTTQPAPLSESISRQIYIMSN